MAKRVAHMMTLNSLDISHLLSTLGIVLATFSTILLNYMTRSSIPGPRLAKFTSLILRYHQITQTSDTYIHKLHSIYGPIVQISSDQISITSPSAIRDVFAVHRRLDRPFPLIPFHNYGTENLVSTIDGNLHSERRKCVRAQYNRRVIEGERVRRILEGCIGEDGLVEYIDTHPRSAGYHRSNGDGGTDGSVDIFWLFRYLGVDFMSAFVYGEQFGLKLLHDKNARLAFQGDFEWDEKRMKNLASLVMFFMPRFSVWLRNRGWRIGETPEDMVMSKIGRKAMTTYAVSAKGKTGAGETLCEQLVTSFERDGPSGSLPSREYVLSECLDHFLAGVTTTADALTSAVFYLSHPKNKARQERLRREILEAGIKLSSEDSLDQLRKLKYLECVIRETLRRNPAVPDPLTRKVGSGDDINIEGHRVSPGMEIGFQPYSVHRDSDVFPDSDSWTPERWEDAEKYASMKRHLVPFGAGPRLCIGMNVAWNQMYAAIAGIYSKYETSLPENMLHNYPEAILGGPEKNEERKKLRVLFRKEQG